MTSSNGLMLQLDEVIDLPFQGGLYNSTGFSATVARRKEPILGTYKRIAAVDLIGQNRN